MKILHVGVGVRGQHWLDIVKDYPEAASVGCVDPSHSPLERVARQYPALRRFTSLDEALKDVQADAAIIASPVSKHAENALKCLKAGLAVMVEKPFASTVAEAWKVVETAEALGRPVIVAQNYRFSRVERSLRYFIQQGCLGKILNVHCTCRRLRPGRGTYLGSVNYAQITDDAVHHFDSLRAILECNPVSVFARSINPSWSDYRHGAATEALIQMSGDIHVQYLGTLTSHRYGFNLRIEGEKGVYWTNRKWVLHRKLGKRFFLPVRLAQVPKGDSAPYPREGTTSLLNSLRDALFQNRMPETCGRDNLWTLAIVEAGMRSDRERREVRIEEILQIRTA